jgi:outer membrane protein OmpA-like peptidoglycan-associated protein
MTGIRVLGALLLPMILASCAGSPPLAPVIEATPATQEASVAPVVVKAAPVPLKPKPPTEAQVMAAVDDENSVFFAVGSTQLDAAGQAKLKLHAEHLKDDQKLVVALVGHTDDQGSPSYNLAIAEQRVSAVRKQLRRYGVRSSQIRRQLGGRVKLAVTCRSAECRRKMRRVELEYVD